MTRPYWWPPTPTSGVRHSRKWRFRQPCCAPGNLCRWAHDDRGGRPRPRGSRRAPLAGRLGSIRRDLGAEWTSGGLTYRFRAGPAAVRQRGQLEILMPNAVELNDFLRRSWPARAGATSPHLQGPRPRHRTGPREGRRISAHRHRPERPGVDGGFHPPSPSDRRRRTAGSGPQRLGQSPTRRIPRPNDAGARRPTLPCGRPRCSGWLTPSRPWPRLVPCSWTSSGVGWPDEGARCLRPRHPGSTSAGAGPLGLRLVAAIADPMPTTPYDRGWATGEAGSITSSWPPTGPRNCRVVVRGPAGTAVGVRPVPEPERIPRDHPGPQRRDALDRRTGGRTTGRARPP